MYSEKRFLLADDMGMFKTAQAIFANSKFREKKKNLRTLIVCPTSVREHWANELNKWSYPGGDINVIHSNNFKESFGKVKQSTWNIISYPLMSCLGDDLGDKLRKIGFHHVIADEVHNAKNPAALRTRALKTLVDQADYASLLSGTPIPNTVSDLYVLMSMLDPSEYPFDPSEGIDDNSNLKIARQKFTQLYLSNPQIVKELFHKKMLRREAGDYLSEQIPQVKNHKIEIPLSGRHLETYLSVVGEEMPIGRKIMNLAKATLDPFLIDSSLPRTSRGKSISDKYAALDDIVEKEVSRKDGKGKVLIFSNLKTGVVDNLTERYKAHRAIKITGDVTAGGGKREAARLEFQRDPKTKVLIATSAMNEGVDLTAATAIVDLTIPYTPAERNQRWKRSHRPGEIKKDKLDIYTLCTTIPGPQQSLDSALIGMVDSKEEVASYFLKGIQMSREDLRNFDSVTKVSTIKMATDSPNKYILQYYLKWRGIGGERASKKIEKFSENSKYISEIYPNFNMTKNASKIYIPIIKKIEEKEGALKRKVDIGCGPGMLGFHLDEPTIGIDISPDMIEVGKKLYPKNNLMVGNMDKLPLEKDTADLTVCSLSYQMAEPTKERARSLKEMSRVLRDGGYSVITIPKNYMDKKDETGFENAASDYGFSIKDHQKEVGPSKIDFYVLQKTHDSLTNKLHDLSWKGDPRRK
ncbi:methyltransferase domain-containing protein [Candidatus Pacearchaeota archaeon]|nr:methyltransferase domain-containing protein [Candidatus Pacearchaeota archaeon]